MVTEQLSQLLDIAKSLQLEIVVRDLKNLLKRAEDPNKKVVFPLIGEFSSGKTTLINALTDTKQLETATKPTTATLFEVHFGSDRNYAEIVYADGKIEEVTDLSLLKNDSLTDAEIVTLYDTSTKVPNSTILIDTPGLSSSNRQHKQTLIESLPMADGILLVSDINQQLTRTTVDFINTMKLTKRPIYIILTKADSKEKSEVDEAKQYISKSYMIPMAQVVAVSAKAGDIDELYKVIEDIQANKNEVAERSDYIRLTELAKILSTHVDDLLSASLSNEDLDLAIRKQDYELKTIEREIKKISNKAEEKIKELEKTVVRSFEDNTTIALEQIVNYSDIDFNSEAYSVIENNIAIKLEEYRSAIKLIFSTLIREKSETDISLLTLNSIDLDNLALENIAFNLDLNSLGHENDKKWAFAAKAIVAVGAAAAIATTGGAAAAPIAAGAGTTTTAAGTFAAINILDTVTDIGSIASNIKTRKMIKMGRMISKEVPRTLETVEEIDNQTGRFIGEDKGIVQGLVSKITDKTSGKPQRRKAIKDYMSTSLIPAFKSGLKRNRNILISLILSALQEGAADIIKQKTTVLKEMQESKSKEKEQFDKQKDQLKSYKRILQTIN